MEIFSEVKFTFNNHNELQVLLALVIRFHVHQNGLFTMLHEYIHQIWEKRKGQIMNVNITCIK